MGINLSGQIVILDEAHNIEDFCREVVSWCVSTTELDEAMIDLNNFCKFKWSKLSDQ